MLHHENPPLYVLRPKQLLNIIESTAPESNLDLNTLLSTQECLIDVPATQHQCCFWITGLPGE